MSSNDITLTIKNYRCFADISPLTITLGPAFTALVGPNNSGKSSFLRFFYEFRELFDAGVALNLALNGINVNAKDVFDPLEVFCDFNDRSQSFSLEFQGAAVHGAIPFATGLVITRDRNGHCTGSYRWQPQPPSLR